MTGIDAPGTPNLRDAPMPLDQTPPEQPQDAAGQPHLWCTDCRTPLRTQYYALDERPVCGRCGTAYASKIARGEGPGSMMRAVMYGLGAALAGAALIALVVQMVGVGRILCAIAIGWLVAMAINKATGEYFGRRYRILAVGLTYFAVGLGSLAPVVIALTRVPDEPVVVAAALDTPEDDEYINLAAEMNEERAKSPDQRMAEDLAQGGPLSMATGMLIMLLTLPLLSIFTFGIHGAVVGVLALGYGMFKAWELTGKGVAYTLTGPFRVGQGPIAPAR